VMRIGRGLAARSEKPSVRMDVVLSTRPPSRGVTPPPRVLSKGTVTTYWFAVPSMSLYRTLRKQARNRTSRSSGTFPAAKEIFRGLSPHRLELPFREHVRPDVTAHAAAIRRQRRCPLSRVLFPFYAHGNESPLDQGSSQSPGSGLPGPIRSPSRVTLPPRGLLLSLPSGLVSCRIRTWGSPFRAFPSMRRRSSFEPRCPPGIAGRISGRVKIGSCSRGSAPS
jgi:hypothetical protein